MTGGQTTRSKVGAVFFAAVMVVSMVAIGGLAGTAAADATNIEIDDNQANDGTNGYQASTVSTNGGSNIKIRADTDSAPNGGSENLYVLIDGDDSKDGGADEVTAQKTSTDSTDDEITGIDVSGLSEGTYDVYVHEATSEPSTVGGYNTEATGLLEIDKTAPTIQSAIKQGGANQIRVSFSEPVTDTDSTGDSATLANSDFDYADNNNAGAGDFAATSPSQVDASTVDVFTDASLTSGDLGTDQLNGLDDGTNGIQDPAGNTISTSQVVIQSQTLAGGPDAGAQWAVGGDGSADVVAGSANESLGEIKLRDDPANSDAAFAGETRLTFPEGVTVNTSASSLNTNTVITSQNDGVSVDSVDVTNNDRTITIEHSGTSNNGEEIRIASGSVVLNVDASELNTASTTTNLDVELDTFSGTEDMTGFLVMKSPDASEQNADKPVSINSENQGLSGNPDVRISQASIAQSIEGTNEPLIGNETEIVLTLEDGSGVTFDADQISDVVEDAAQDVDDDGTDELDDSSVSVNGNELRVPVVDDIDAAGIDEDIDFQNLVVETSGSATDADLNVSVEAPAVSNGEYILDGGANDAPTVTDFVDVQSPDIESNTDENIVVGSDGQDFTSNLRVDTTSPSTTISSGSTIVISTNSSAVSFVNDGESTDGDGQVNQGDLGGGASGDVESISINNDGDLVIETNGDIDNEDLHIAGGVGDQDIELAVDSSAPDEVDVQFEMTIDDTVDVADVDDVLTLERPNSVVNNGQNFTATVDQDGEELQVDPDSSQALVITSDNIDGQIFDATNITVSLEENTGVTFDQSASVAVATDAVASAPTDSDESIEIYGDTDGDESTAEDDVFGGPSDAVNDATLNSNSIEIELTDDETGSSGPDVSLDAGDQIVLDELPLNVTESASNTSISVTTDTSDNEVTTEAAEQITTNQIQGTDLRADADFSDDSVDLAGDGVDVSVSKPTVEKSLPSVVKVENSINNFGGATVNLEVVETPEGSSGASLNTTQLTTNSNGLAFFNFTAGDTTGDYVVNASLEGASGTDSALNLTYTAQSGGVDSVSVTPIENAIVGGSGEVDQAALYVNATDANGNPVNANPTVDVTADNVGASEIVVYDNKDVDGSRDTLSSGSPADSLSDGEFTIDSTNNDGSSVIEINSDQVEDVTVTVSYQGNSDSGTVTFYDNVGQVDLALNQSTVEVDDTVAAEATISESDGTTIEVPDVQVDYDDNNNGNTTFDGDADAVSASTNDAGVASVNVTAEQLGSSTIDAQSNLRSDSATLSIVETAGAQVQLADVNLEPSSVTANTTNDHTLTFDALNVSDDGNTDTFTVTIPDAATLESANGVNVTDADNESVQVEGLDVSGNVITVDVAPDSSAETRNLTVEANVTVSAPDVANTTEADITIDAVDSNNGEDSAAATLTVTAEDAAGDLAPYTNDNGVVDAGGLQDAAADFRSGDIGPTVLQDAAAAFRSGESLI